MGYYILLVFQLLQLVQWDIVTNGGRKGIVIFKKAKYGQCSFKCVKTVRASVWNIGCAVVVKKKFKLLFHDFAPKQTPLFFYVSERWGKGKGRKKKKKVALMVVENVKHMDQMFIVGLGSFMTMPNLPLS